LRRNALARPARKHAEEGDEVGIVGEQAIVVEVDVVAGVAGRAGIIGKGALTGVDAARPTTNGALKGVEGALGASNGAPTSADEVFAAVNGAFAAVNGVLMGFGRAQNGSEKVVASCCCTNADVQHTKQAITKPTSQLSESRCTALPN
jgi:hypothetical protein